MKTEDLEKRDYDIARTCRDLMPFSINGSPRFIRRDNWMGEYVAGIQNNVNGKLPIKDWIKDGTIDGRWVYGTERGKDIFRSKNMFFSNWNKQLPSLFSYGSVVYEDGKTDWSKTVFGRIIDEYLTLREELYHGASGLLLHVLDRDGLQFFASAPGWDDAAAYLRIRLGDAAPEDVPALCSLCAGACLLSAFHQYAAGRLTA